MRIAVYNRYWHTSGGGEKYIGWIASALATRHEVTLLSEAAVDRVVLSERLGIDLGAVAERIFGPDPNRIGDAARDYDLLVNGSFASDLECTAPNGMYVVHFPVPGPAGGSSRPFWRRAASRIRHPRAPGAARSPLGFLSTYEHLVANSEFTRRWVRRLWDRDAQVLHPAIPPIAEGSKRPIILSVGRFFSPERGHCKKQLELVEAFRHLHAAGASGWEYHLVGGRDPLDVDYLDAVRGAAAGLPVHIHADASGAELSRLYASARIFWHATGLGEDAERHPERLEHFGIATVEAMSAGCVPIVYGDGGPAEVVEDGRSGRHFTGPEELVDRTRELIADDDLRGRMSAGARRRASAFAPQVATQRLHRLVDNVGSTQEPTTEPENIAQQGR